MLSHQITKGRGALTPLDLAKLATSYLTLETIAAAQIRRVDTHEGAQIIGRLPKANANYAGLVFPYIWPGETRARESRLRRDEPDLEARSDGTVKEKGKYLSPPGKSNLLYFLPTTDAAWLADSSKPVTITEGEKKTLALTRFYTERDEQRLVVGLSGVWNWRGTIGKQADEKGKRCNVKGVIPDIERITWKDRQVLIVFDSDVATNENVKKARTGLANVLQERGAVVSVVDLPEVAGVNGVDDLLAVKGTDFVSELFRQAAPQAEKRESQATALIKTATDRASVSAPRRAKAKPALPKPK